MKENIRFLVLHCYSCAQLRYHKWCCWRTSRKKFMYGMHAHYHATIFFLEYHCMHIPLLTCAQVNAFFFFYLFAYLYTLYERKCFWMCADRRHRRNVTLLCFFGSLSWWRVNPIVQLSPLLLFFAFLEIMGNKKQQSFCRALFPFIFIHASKSCIYELEKFYM